jgi:kumamolisin
MNEMTRTPLVGSSIPQPIHIVSASLADANQLIQINVILVRPTYQGLTLQQYADAVITNSKPILDHEQFESAFGIDTSDFDAVSAFAATYGLTEQWRSASAGYIKFGGTIGACNAAFGIELENIDTGSRVYRSYRGDISVHTDVADKIMHVMGLDGLVSLVKHARRYQEAGISQAATYLTPYEVGNAYDFPPYINDYPAAVTNVAIIEVGGGYTTADLDSTFAYNGLAIPSIVDISVNGGVNYGSSGSASDETMLDILCCGGAALYAKLLMYFAPDTLDLNTGLTYIYDAVNAAVIDNVNNPSVISVSYGFGQSYWNSVPGLVASFETTFQQAVIKGISICVASGDDGAQGRDDTAPSVGYPGSSPYCICCGGTSLQLSAGSIASETVWNQGDGGTGGGITSFALPSYQTGLGLTATPYTTGPGIPQALTNRGAPDLAANSDPATGYRLFVGSTLYQYGGTSAAAPLIAGLISKINSNLNTRIGFINSKIYNNPAAFSDITVGDNCCTDLQSIGWAATSGWDACTGLGSPIGTSIQSIYSALATGAVYPNYLVGARTSSGQTYPRPYITA